MENNSVEVEERRTTDPFLDCAKASNGAKSPIETEIAKKIEQRSKHEAHLNSGCGSGKKQSQVLSAFWGTMWKELESIGWVKVEAVGKEEGAIYFIPPDRNCVNPSSAKTEGKVGVDYYDRIQHIIDRIEASNDEIEKKIAQSYKENLALAEPKKKQKSQTSRKCSENTELTALQSRPKRSSITLNGSSSNGEPIAPLKTRKRRKSVSSEEQVSAPLTRKRGRPPLAGRALDLSWKDGGSLYPKQSSQIGEEFQATDIPAAGNFIPGECSDLWKTIWDPKCAKSEAYESLLASSVPANKKEQVFVTLGLMALDPKVDATPNIAEIVSSVQPTDGSDWTKDDQEKFAVEIFRLRKDMTALSKSMGKDMQSCLTYYLGTYKKSDAYRLLKTVCADERHNKAVSSVHGVDACAICGDGGSLLICDGCEGEYHMGCLRPALRTIPEGHWECDECVDKKLLKAREKIISQTSLYETVPRKKLAGEGSANENEKVDEPAASETILRPVSTVLAEVKLFADRINAIFSSSNEGSKPDAAQNISSMEVKTTAHQLSSVM